MGLGADNVGREHMPESMIVGQARCSIASQALFHCKPLHLSVSARGTYGAGSPPPAGTAAGGAIVGPATGGSGATGTLDANPGSPAIRGRGGGTSYGVVVGATGSYDASRGAGGAAGRPAGRHKPWSVCNVRLRTGQLFIQLPATRAVTSGSGSQAWRS